MLPSRFRRPVAIIYAFARQADDFADEGERTDEERIALLESFRLELGRIAEGSCPETGLFKDLGEIIHEYGLPLQPFFDLLDAFSRDVVKKRYGDFDELLAYCSKSANPIGRLLIALYGIDSEKNRLYSDHVCTSLQLINFLQDVAIDLEKGRIYLPMDEMKRYGAEIGKLDASWEAFMKHQAHRAKSMMLEGAPLAGQMKGRLAFEMRMIINGGLRIIEKLEKNRWDMFSHRPKLVKTDWILLLCRSLSRT